MVAKKNMSLLEKEAQLLKKIEKAKAELAKLNEKKVKEYGKLAIQHGLDQFDMKIIDKAFASLSKELSNGH